MCLFIKEENEWNKIHDEKTEKKHNLTDVIKVKMTIETWDKKNILRGRTTRRSCNLNFCPTCGRKIEKKETVRHW